MYELNFDNMRGRSLRRVSLSRDKTKITFEFEDGFKRSFGVSGDCCSDSWIEHLEQPKDVSGAIVVEVVHADIDAFDKKDEETGLFSEYIQVYNTTFHTTRGDIVLEFRNSSNGFYGGYLVDLKETA